MAMGNTLRQQQVAAGAAAGRRLQPRAGCSEAVGCSWCCNGQRIEGGRRLQQESTCNGECAAAGSALQWGVCCNREHVATKIWLQQVKGMHCTREYVAIGGMLRSGHALLQGAQCNGEHMAIRQRVAGVPQPCPCHHIPAHRCRVTTLRYCCRSL